MSLYFDVQRFERFFNRNEEIDARGDGFAGSISCVVMIVVAYRGWQPYLQ